MFFSPFTHSLVTHAHHSNMVYADEEIVPLFLNSLLSLLNDKCFLSNKELAVGLHLYLIFLLSLLLFFFSFSFLFFFFPSKVIPLFGDRNSVSSSSRSATATSCCDCFNLSHKDCCLPLSLRLPSGSHLPPPFPRCATMYSLRWLNL